MTIMDNDLDIDLLHGVADPIDLIEYIASGSKWPVKRLSETRAIVTLKFSGTQYQLFISFDEDEGLLRLTCAFNLKIHANQKLAMLELLNHINAKTWFGSFTYDFQEHQMIFWYALILPDNMDIRLEQTYALLNSAPEMCHRLLPCFQAIQESNLEKAKTISSAWSRAEGNA